MFGSNKKLSKSSISLPSDFRHLVHIDENNDNKNFNSIDKDLYLQIFSVLKVDDQSLGSIWKNHIDSINLQKNLENSLKQERNIRSYVNQPTSHFYTNIKPSKKSYRAPPPPKIDQYFETNVPSNSDYLFQNETSENGCHKAQHSNFPLELYEHASNPKHASKEIVSPTEASTIGSSSQPQNNYLSPICHEKNVLYDLDKWLDTLAEDDFENFSTFKTSKSHGLTKIIGRDPAFLNKKGLNNEHIPSSLAKYMSEKRKRPCLPIMVKTDNGEHLTEFPKRSTPGSSQLQLEGGDKSVDLLKVPIPKPRTRKLKIEQKEGSKEEESEQETIIVRL